MTLHGCIEAGGTKFIAGIVRDDRTILAETRIPTTTPDETIGRTLHWLKEQACGRIAAIGIATFGPAGVDPSAPDWGCITTTPKPGWQGTDMAGPFAAAFGVPVGFDSDVNGAVMAEARWGAAQGHRMAVYVTLGTGIGGGAALDGRPLRGRSHPEMGHIPVRRDPADGAFAGTCPFHGDCLEGLASGPAIIARWGVPLSDLPPDHPGHTIIAGYVAQLCVTLEAMLSPGRIVIGGGVADTPGLIEAIRAHAAIRAGGYFPGFDPAAIVSPGLGERSGLMGALALAQDASSALP
ncbi:MAG: ROK family protein [Sphingobium sp.]